MELQQIPLKKIKIGKNNPRKHFPDKELEELAVSIEKNGLINPITVRPKGKSYELVSGERRFRACKINELEEIPATVRELTDEQAFDIQVVENLQREDVHPLDEAEGFRRMLDSGRYDVKEICARLGKSESFVTRRLLLNDLVPGIKEAFYAEKLGVGQALEICRLPQEDQQDLYEEVYKKEDRWNGFPSVKRLTGIIDTNYINKLSAAPFNPEDKNLVPAAGPCSSCPKRSGANKTLFGDVEDEDICFDRSCFLQKAEAVFLLNVDHAKEKDMVLIYSDQDEFVKEIKKEGYTVLTEYDDFWERPNNKLSDPRMRKAFWIQGYKRGEFTKIQLNQKAVSKAESAGLEPSAEEQIQKIEEREARAIELDREKVQRATIEEMGKFDDPEEILNTGRILCFSVFAMYNAGFDTILEEKIFDEAIRQLNVKKKKENIGWSEKRRLIATYLLEYGDSWAVEILRAHYQYRMTSQSELDYGKSSVPLAFRLLALELIPSKVLEFNQIQNQKAEKRRKRVQERIKKLKVQAGQEKPGKKSKAKKKKAKT